MNETPSYAEILSFSQETLRYTREKLTKDEKAKMRRELINYRHDNAYFKVTARLKGIPFRCSPALFGITLFPCGVFGRQLVLKIIDELLDEGKGGK